MIEFSAVADPRLIRDRRLVVTKVTAIELTGNSQRTAENQGLNGTASSLAKAYSCLEAVAIAVTLHSIVINITHTDMAVAPEAVWVAL